MTAVCIRLLLGAGWRIALDQLQAADYGQAEPGGMSGDSAADQCLPIRFVWVKHSTAGGLRQRRCKDLLKNLHVHLYTD